MGAAPLVLLLVGMVFPILLVLLAVLFDVLAVIWVVYRLWHDEWSVSLWRSLHRVGHVSHGHLLRNH